jgi:hypothetical protein
MTTNVTSCPRNVPGVNDFTHHLSPASYGLAYHFLVTQQGQFHLGGADFGGTGGQRGDELMSTAGDWRFAVLVELKKPTSALLSGSKPYRNGAWQIGPELTGGVAQLQANCERIVIDAQAGENVRYLDAHGLTVAMPKGILLVRGHDKVPTGGRVKVPTLELI